MKKKEDSFFWKYLKHEEKKISKFLTSKDLLIFLFFLLISASLWAMRSSKDNHETFITIPIKYVNAPEGLIQQEELPENLTVTVTGDTPSLVRYRWFYSWIHSFVPVEIDASSYADGRYSITTANFEPQIRKQLNGTTKIVKIAPATINFEFEKLTKKEVPVVFNGRVSLSPQYIKSGDIEMKPTHIVLFGTKASLDTITRIETIFTEIKDVHGTKTQIARLAPIKDVSFSQDTIHCTQNSERYTEKTVDISIRTRNAKKGFKIRTFPVVAKVKFHVGISNYEKVTADMLKVTADYEEAVGSRIPLRIEGGEDLINAIEIIPASVDYLLEKND